MKENTNRALALNSLVLYVRLAIISVSGLLYTRFSLQALGISDYGLYSVIACIITFIGVVNTIMVTTSNRFIAMAIGHGDRQEACRQFNVNLVVHICIALLTIIVALPLGRWYIAHYVSYCGDMGVVRTVFNVSVVASAVSFVGVPYNGLLIAKERFFVFCATDVAMSLFKLFFTYLLIDHFGHKLIVYTLVMAFMTAFPTLVYFAYCRKAFAEITRFVFVRQWGKYVEVLRFSMAIGLGAVALIGKTQGGALIINMFFTTVMNAGLAVANSVNTILQTFANNAQKPVSPQIVKSYAMGDMERCEHLVCLASKATYLSMFFVSIPFMLVPELIFGLWLKEVPPYAVTFTRLLIVDGLIFCINAGVTDFVNATGKIRLYQIVVNSFVVASVVVGYLAIRCGMPPEYLFYVYIAFSFLVFLVRPFVLVHISDFNVKRLVLDSYVPVFATSLLFALVFFLKAWLPSIAYGVLAYAYFLVLVYVCALNRVERAWICNRLRRIMNSRAKENGNVGKQ